MAFDAYKFTVPENKRFRVIVNTDCKNEADDQFALAHHLMTPKFDVRGIIAAHFEAKADEGKGESMQKSYDEILKVLELMDLTATSRKLLDTPARNLFGGEQRRVALLRALAVRPDYLILDELTSGLDLISQKAIREVLEAYHREYRCSYLLITHDMKFAYSLSQRIYELEHGQIIRIGQSNIDINSKERT